MLSGDTKTLVHQQDANMEGKSVRPPKYDPGTHYIEVSRNEYYRALVELRHTIKMLSDQYMSAIVGAKNIDLFMLTPSVSSPMGPGSDSEAIAIKFGDLTTFLTDSSQFGFEPILMNGIDRAYCYLPSMRGEDPDKRHLNQFFHCEIEIKGDLDDILQLAEEYVKYLCAGIVKSKTLITRMSVDPDRSLTVLQSIITTPSFKHITFDEACRILEENDNGCYINKTDHGRDISSKGELALMELLNITTPIWLTHFDRDRVPFYQKPDPLSADKILNADLLFPPLIAGGFGGEVLGAGQRQDTVTEMYDSLKRQNLGSKPYEWYINLRRDSRYRTTSGFGLGIERYIAWMLGLDSIQDVILYPRLKNVATMP